MTTDLFVYGTLHPDRAPQEIARTVRTFRPVGPATMRGRVHDLGRYPAFTLEGADQVMGTLFAVPDDPKIFAALDAYEDFRSENLAESLFVRVRRLATLPDQSQRLCWVYIYNQSLPDVETCDKR